MGRTWKDPQDVATDRRRAWCGLVESLCPIVGLKGRRRWSTERRHITAPLGVCGSINIINVPPSSAPCETLGQASFNHSDLSCVSHFNSFHIVPTSAISLSVAVLQTFIGFSIPLSPDLFHFKASYGYLLIYILNTCPNCFDLLFLSSLIMSLISVPWAIYAIVTSCSRRSLLNNANKTIWGDLHFEILCFRVSEP